MVEHVSRSTRIRVWSVRLSALLVVISLLVLAGWQWDVELLKRPIPSLTAMNPATALCFLIAALSLPGIAARKAGGYLKNAGLYLSASLVLSGILRLLGVAFDSFWQIDQMIYSGKLLTDAAAGSLSRMAPNTAVNFILAGSAILIMNRGWFRKNAPAQWIALIILTLAYFAVLGYVYEVPEFYWSLPYLPMSIHTAVSFILLAMAILFAAPETGLMKEYTSPSEGGRIARTLIPVVLFLPMVIGYLRLFGEWYSVFSTEFGVALIIASFTLFFIVAVTGIALALNRRDEIRRKGEGQLLELNMELKASEEETATLNEELTASNEELTAANEELTMMNEQLHASAEKIRQQSEIIVKQKDEQLNRVLESTNHIVWSFDLSGKGQNYISRSIERLVGDTADSFLRSEDPWTERVYAPDRETWRASKQHLLETGETEGTFRLINSRGELHWMHVQLRLTKDEFGRPVREEGIASDITSIKEAERAVSRERNLLRSLIDNLPDYIFVKDRKFRHLINNRANLELIGAANEEETLGKSVVDYFGKGAEAYLEDDRRVFSTGEPIINKEESIVNKNGEEKILLTTKVPLRDEEGRITGLIGISRDITDFRRQEQVLNQYRENMDVIFSNTVEEILLLDNKGRIVMFNKALEKFLQEATCKKPEAGRFLWDTTVKERSEASKKLFAKALQGEAFIVDAPMKTANGEEVIHELHYEPVFINKKVKYVTVISSDVTAKRAQEKMLHDFQNAIYHTSIVSRANRKGDITFVNENFVKISGFTSAELLGQNHRLTNSNHHPRSFWVEMWKTISSGKIWRGEVRNKAKNGDIFWVDKFIMPLLDEDGNVREFLSISNDITYRKQTEEDLERSKYFLEKAQETAHIGYWISEIGFEDAKLTWSKETMNIFGITESEFDGRIETFLSAVHPDDLEKVREALRRAVKGERNFGIEHRIVLPNGLTRWVQEQAEVTRDADGNAQLIVGVVQDITERKTVEEILLEYNERYEILSKATNDAIWDWDIQHDFQIWNHGLQTIFGYTERAIESTQQWFRDKIHSEDYLRVDGEIREAFAKKLTNWTSTYRYKCADGNYKYVLDRAYINYMDEKPVRMIGAIQDITEVVRYRQGLERMVEERTRELNEALQKEKELVEMKSKFVSIASHEFRTPLSTISIASGFIKKYKQKLSSDEVDKKLDNIDKQVHHMTYLLDDVLLIGRSEAGKIQIHVSPVLLRDFFQQMITEVVQSTRRTHQVRLYFDSAREKFNTDEKLMRNIIINLLTNAIKFSPYGSDVDLHVKDADSWLNIKIKDCGMGIPEGDRRNLFESFFRGSNVGTIPGTGLGLSIVKKAVDLLSGQITVESELGKGTEFSILLRSLPDA